MITLRQLRYWPHSPGTGISAAPPRTAPSRSRRCRCRSANWSSEIGAELVERRPGDIVLTEIGVEVAQRAEQILAAARDLVDFARHRDLLTGSLTLGIIPTLAPYVLPRVLPRLQADYPQLRLEVRETQTRMLLDELPAARSTA